MLKSGSFFVLIVLNGLLAQTSITGSITDEESGKPLIGANVLIKGSTMGAATDVKGSYTIPNVPAGSYILTANYIGYETVEKDIVVESEKVNRFDFKLLTSAIQMETLSLIHI